MTREALQNFVGSLVRAKMGSQDAWATLSANGDGTLMLAAQLAAAPDGHSEDLCYELSDSDIRSLRLEHDSLVSPLDLQACLRSPKELPLPEILSGPDSSIE